MANLLQQRALLQKDAWKRLDINDLEDIADDQESLPELLGKILHECPHWSVRDNAANNKRTPNTALVWALLNDKDTQVQEEAYLNPNTPQWAKKLFEQSYY